MPHTTIRLPDVGGVTLLAAAGGTVYVPLRRLSAWVYLGSESQLRPAIVDTGAPVCVLPRRVGDVLALRGEVEWLTDMPARLAAGTNAGTAAVTTLGGGHYPYRLGRVMLNLADLGDGQLIARKVLAICTDDPPRAPGQDPLPLIVGVADILNGRSLLLQASESGERWLGLLTEP